LLSKLADLKKFVMRKLIFLFFLIVSVHSLAQSKDEGLVRQILNEQAKAWNKGDIDDFMKGYWENDSLMFIGKSGVTYGWNNTLNNYKKKYPETAAMGKLSFDIINMKRLSFQYFHVVGKWHLQRSIGNLEGHFTLLFKKIKNNWVIIADHSS
jgi:ketosteroid isomerase-like protein